MKRAFSFQHLLLLLSLAGVLFFVGLGSMGLTDRDEGRNAEAGREMYETGDWISPSFNYALRVAKPVFLYWLMSLSYCLFGVNEFAARFPSAFFGIALVLLQYLFLARVRDSLVALFAGLMLLLNVEIIGLGRMALTDSVLIFFVTLSLYGFWLGLWGEGRERHWIWVFYVSMALATLTKGPVGVMVPLLTATLYLTFSRRWGEYWRRGFPLAGTLVFIMLALPWYVAMLAIHGEAYSTVAQAHTIGRFLHPMEGHGGTIFFYIPILFLGFFPWSGFLPVSLYQTFKDWRVRSHLTPEAGSSISSTDLELFAAIWVVGVFAFFAVSSTRLPHYIGPLFPGAAILTASYWHRALADPHTPGMRASIRTVMGLGYLLGFALASLPSLYSMFVEQIAKEFPVAPTIDPGLGPYAAALILVVGVALVGYFGLSEQRRAGAFWAAGAMIGLVILIAIQMTLPHANRYFVAPPQELAYAAGVNLGPGDRLLVYGVSRPSLVFYARRKIEYFSPGEEAGMGPILTQPGRTMILLPARLRQDLPAEAAGFPVILQRYGYLLLGNEPMVKQIPSAQPSTSSRPAFSH